MKWALQGITSPPSVVTLTPGLHIVRIGATTVGYRVEDAAPVLIFSVKTPAKHRRQGAARAALAAFLAATDVAGREVELCASPLDQRTHPGRLVHFYRSLGFQLTGKSCNPLRHPVMLRPVGASVR